MRVRRYVTMAAALLAALLVTTVAESQDQNQRRPGDRQGQRGRGPGGRTFGGRGFRGPGFGGPGGGNTSLLGLLRVDEVKKEIKLDGSQDELVKVVEEEVRGEQPQQRFNFREATEAEREKYLADRRARAAEQAKAAKEMLATVLSKEQMQRLSEIRIQQMGLAALTDPDVEKALKITREQKELIAKLLREGGEEMQAKMRELFGGGRGGDRGRGGDAGDRRPNQNADRGDNPDRAGDRGRGRAGDRGRGRPGGGNFEQVREQLDALRAGMEKKVLAALSSEQLKQFEAMKGKKFDMPRPNFGARGRGGDRGRGRGGDRGTAGGERRRPPTEP